MIVITWLINCTIYLLYGSVICKKRTLHSSLTWQRQNFDKSKRCKVQLFNQKRNVYCSDNCRHCTQLRDSHLLILNAMCWIVKLVSFKRKESYSLRLRWNTEKHRKKTHA